MKQRNFFQHLNWEFVWQRENPFKDGILAARQCKELFKIKPFASLCLTLFTFFFLLFSIILPLVHRDNMLGSQKHSSGMTMWLLGCGSSIRGTFCTASVACVVDQEFGNKWPWKKCWKTSVSIVLKLNFGKFEKFSNCLCEESFVSFGEIMVKNCWNVLKNL